MADDGRKVLKLETTLRMQRWTSVVVHSTVMRLYNWNQALIVDGRTKHIALEGAKSALLTEPGSPVYVCEDDQRDWALKVTLDRNGRLCQTELTGDDIPVWLRKAQGMP